HGEVTPAPPTGVTLKDAERLHLALTSAAQQARTRRIFEATQYSMAIGLGTAAAFALFAPPNDLRARQIVGWTSLGIAAVGITAVAVPMLARATDEEHRLLGFEKLRLDTDEDRAQAVFATEQELERAADEAHRGRVKLGITSLALGGLVAAYG